MSAVAECVFIPTLNCPCVINTEGTYKLLEDVTCSGCTDVDGCTVIKFESNDVI